MSPSARDIHPTDEDLSVGTPDMGHPAFRMGHMEGSAWTPMSPNARDIHPRDEDLSVGIPDMGHPASQDPAPRFLVCTILLRPAISGSLV